MRDWALGADGLRSMAVPSGGQYGVEEGLVSSFPVRCSGGNYEIAESLDVGKFAQSKIDITVDEIKEERDAVKGLGLLG
jgi:malate dehydrogenase